MSVELDLMNACLDNEKKCRELAAQMLDGAKATGDQEMATHMEEILGFFDDQIRDMSVEIIDRTAVEQANQLHQRALSDVNLEEYKLAGKPPEVKGQ